VLLVLAEKGHTAELVQVDLPTGEHLRSAHLMRHPFGKIPVLEQDDFVLYESTAIMRYLDETLPGLALTPGAARERARVDQLLSVETAYLAPAVGTLTAQLVTRPQFGVRPDPIEVSQARGDVSETLDVLERALHNPESGAFLAGTLFSLADIAFMPSVQFLIEAGQSDLIQARPHLALWWHAVRARPPLQKVLGHAEPTRLQRRLRAVSSRLAEAL
jgi:glutathione S-transferase